MLLLSMSAPAFPGSWDCWKLSATWGVFGSIGPGLGFQVCGCEVRLSAGLVTREFLDELQIDHRSLEQASKPGEVNISETLQN